MLCRHNRQILVFLVEERWTEMLSLYFVPGRCDNCCIAFVSSSDIGARER